eukprot:CAMPEP_0181096068 /NCGR_PEP_ID=MMETSP1071-20121207/10839_1 /TAXON_ID=35127 /ORGANISM="Thalassiosira sp., Strain NH16" /LENGTH=323 /DNA_ID=CAMNT_0023178459 /DNA_START=256 /DNA_END=1227 /DNA_ORIENTATION=+
MHHSEKLCAEKCNNSGMHKKIMKSYYDDLTSFFTIPDDCKREVRHIFITCDNIKFDVYVLGTNHQTRRSNQDVKRLLNLIRPDMIFVELCRDREEMLYDDLYTKSEYYVAAEYRRMELKAGGGVNQTSTPFLMLGDRPCRLSDLRWWEGLESGLGRFVSFLLWPFLLPFRTRLWGHEILINERDIFMAHELQKGCSYYIKENSDSEPISSANSDTMMSTCGRLKELRDTQKSSLTLNSFFQTNCVTPWPKKGDKQNPSIVAIIGSNHLHGFCDLLDSERNWSPYAMMQVVETQRYSRDHPYSKGIVNNVEEYGRAERERSNQR